MLRPHTYSDGMLRALGRPSITADGWVVRVSKPDETNTGVPAGTTLTPYTGPSTITTDGATIREALFTSKLSIAAKNVTIEGCKSTAVIDGMIQTSNINAKNVLIRRTTFRPSAASTNTIAIVGHDFTAERCDISGTVDGIRISNSNVADGPSGVTVRSCYIHHLCFTTPYSGHSDNETHNDGIQIEGGNDILIEGCHIAAFGDPVYGNIADNPRGPQVLSCIIVTPNVGNVRRLMIAGNWFSGAYVPVNIAEKGRGPLADMMMLDNRFAGDKRLSWDVLLEWTTKAAVDLTKWTGNVRTDTGQPVVFSG